MPEDRECPISEKCDFAALLCVCALLLALGIALTGALAPADAAFIGPCILLLAITGLVTERRFG